MITERNFWFWFGGLWFGVGLLFLVIGVSTGATRAANATRLDTEGRIVDGVVLTKAISSTSSSGSGANTTPTYELTFRFSTPNGVVRGRTEMTREAWDRLVEQGPIRVTYVPEEPSRHRVDGQTSDWMVSLIFAAIGGFFAVAGAFVLLNARRQRAHRTDRRAWISVV